MPVFANRSRRNLKAPSYFIVAAVLIFLGWLGRNSPDPRVFVGRAIIVMLLLVVASGIIWFVGGLMLDKRRERIRFERQASGLCVVCGYDLRAATSDLCPECGIPITRNRPNRVVRW